MTVIKHLLIGWFLMINSIVNGQSIDGFESFGLELDEYLDGSSVLGSFESEYLSLSNTYDPSYGYLGGFAISSMRDTVSSGFQNQFSCISGTGYNNSNSYVISYTYFPEQIKLQSDLDHKSLKGFYINNTTYAYLSMRDGDGFAKKFGGFDGSDPDYFLLSIEAFYNGVVKEEKIEFYLADYRFDNNSEDYILNNWSWVDLEALGQIDSLEFSLSSSDNGQFGMNTPAYFCIDHFEFDDMSLANTELELPDSFTIYPNPATEYIHLENTNYEPVLVTCYDNTGSMVISESTIENGIIDVSLLPTGKYYLSVVSGNRTNGYSFIKL